MLALAVVVGRRRADTASISVPPSLPFRAVTSPPFSPNVLVGVGHDPHPIASVWSAKGACGYTVPASIIPERSECPEHLFQSARANGRDVLEEDPARPDFPREPDDFAEQAGPLSAEAGALARERYVLTGEAAGDDVDPHKSICREPVGSELPHVRVAGDVRPAFRQYGSGEWFTFAKGDGGHSGSLEADAEAADAGEQVKDAHVTPWPPTPPTAAGRGTRDPRGARPIAQ